MKYILGFLIFKVFRDQVVWFCKNYWWVILVLLILAVVGWIIERKEKQHQGGSNDKKGHLETHRQSTRRNKDKKKYLDPKYPRIYFGIMLIIAVISFFLCVSCYNFLKLLILPQANWFLKPLIQTAIMILGYLIPLVIGAILSMSKFAFLQLLGAFFAGIGFGVVVRICLIFVLVLSPYGY